MAELDVKVIPNAKQARIKQMAGETRVYVTAPAVDGKANQALIEQLAGHFQVKKSAIRIIKGLKSRKKTIRIDL